MNELAAAIGNSPGMIDQPAPNPDVSRICKSCNLRRPIHRFRRYRKGSDQRRLECNRCHCEKELERKRNPGSRILREGMKKCTRCRQVLPIGQFRKMTKQRESRHSECNDCRTKGDQRSKKQKQKKSLQRWMAQAHKYRDYPTQIEAFTQEMIRRFGGIERLAAAVKAHFDDAVKNHPGGMYAGMTLRMIVELHSIVSARRSAERVDRQHEEDRRNFAMMTYDELAEYLHTSIERMFLDHPTLWIAVTVQYPDVAQEELEKCGWTVVPSR